MALEMRERCEKRGTSIAIADAAAICSYECTFCPSCAASMAHLCPNCGGELVARPRRRVAAVTPRAVIRRLHELWTAGDLGAVAEVYAPEFVGHFPSNRVVTRYTSRGTHRGEFRGIAPTDRAIAVREISIYRVVKGKVTEQWCLLDELDRLQQLGVVPAASG